VYQQLNNPDETITEATTTFEAVAHIDSNDPGIDRRDEVPLSGPGLSRTALVLDQKDLRLQTRTTDHKTVETMVGSIGEEHRPLHTSVSHRVIIGAPRKRPAAIMVHHKQEGVNKTICHSLRLRIVPIPRQQQHVGGNRDLLDN
jgi:hypothetical protein